MIKESLKKFLESNISQNVEYIEGEIMITPEFVRFFIVSGGTPEQWKSLKAHIEDHCSNHSLDDYSEYQDILNKYYDWWNGR